MLNIVIADDESGIIDLCKMLIEYPNAQVIGEAHNGIELLQKIEALQPNTVITDISMPGMTGIELIEKVREAHPEINFVIMSGYTEFEYAQKALQLGVREYLVKPIQAVSLNQILEKIDRQLEQRQEEAEANANVRNKLEASRAVLMEKYLRDIRQSNAVLPIPVVDGAPVVQLQDYDIQVNRYVLDGRFEGKSLDHEMLRQLSNDIFSSFQSAGIEGEIQNFSYADDLELVEFVLFPSNEDMDAAKEFAKKIYSKKSEAIHKINQQNLFVKASGAVSNVFRGSARNIQEAMKQASTALKWRMEYNDGYLISWNEKDAANFEKLPSFSKGAELSYAITRRNREEADKIFAEVWKKEHHAAGYVGRRYVLTEQMVESFNRACLELPDSEKWWRQCTVSEMLSGEWTSAAMERRFKERVHSVLDCCEEYLNNRENRVILEAKSYIAQHFAEDISLNSIAEHVGLSAAYFSTMFKNEEGTGFAKYLQKVRVEEAKKLLRTTNRKVNDIAEAVGYHDTKSFNKIFQSETQVKPTAYRKFYQ